MIRKTLLVLASGAFVTLVACGSNDATDKYPSSDSFCSAKADAECQGVAAQCGAPVELCNSTRTSACKSAATGKTYHAASAETCINKTHDLFQSKTITAAAEKDQQNACLRVYGGTTTKGGSCSQDADCADQMICDKSVCADMVQKNQGEGCSNPGEICQAGFYCGDQGNFKNCIPKKAENDICSDTVPCLENLRCAGTCKPLLNVQEPCDKDTDCAPTNTPSYCDPNAKKCLPKYGLGTQSCKDFGGS